MSKELIKCLLSHDFYTEWGNYISQEMFARELHPLLKTIREAHEHYQTDLTLAEVRDIHFTSNPTMSESAKEMFNIIIGSVEDCPPYNPDIAKQVIAKVHKANVCRQVIELMVDIEAGNSNDWDELSRLQTLAVSTPDEVGTNVKYDVVDLSNIQDIVDLSSPLGEFKFNISDMQLKTNGCHKASLIIIGARPEAGKTGLGMSLACAPGGFIHQGANVHYWRNEERYQALARRALSAIMQVPSDEIGANIDRFVEIRDNIPGSLTILKDSVTSQKDVVDVRNYLDNNPDLDILVIDQIDNLRIKGVPARNDTRLLEEVYATIREYSIRYNITIIAITQAGADADNKHYFGYSELYGSKTGKGATGDVILCIGYKRPLAGNIDDGLRIINYSKNKFGGSQAPTKTLLTHATSTFTQKEV
jgi:hypothetical protein